MKIIIPIIEKSDGIIQKGSSQNKQKERIRQGQSQTLPALSKSSEETRTWRSSNARDLFRCAWALMDQKCQGYRLSSRRRGLGYSLPGSCDGPGARPGARCWALREPGRRCVGS